MSLRHHPTAAALLVACWLCAPCLGAGDAPPSASAEAVAAYREGLEKWKAGQQKAAQAAFACAAELAPQWGAPNARLGVILQLQGQEAAARRQYALAQTASLAQDNHCPETLSEDAMKVRDLLIANEAYVLYLVNAARLEKGLSVLVPDPTMSVAARRHSDEMRDKCYFGHTSPTPGLTGCQDRFRAVFGFMPRMIGENVSRRWGQGLYCLSEPRVHESHVDLMNSPGHRANILRPEFEWLGVGLAANDNGDYWITELFAQPGR